MIVNDNNAINRYAVNLGATADEVKQYFDVSVYRNVLDMLNTFQGVLTLWGNSLWNEGVKIPNGVRDKIAVGYAIPLVGKHGNKSGNSPAVLSQRTLNSVGLGTYKPIYDTWLKPSHKFPYKNTRSGVVYDLLNLGRSINWELNRLRLPVPHNFRQINDKIQNRDYFAATLKCSIEPDSGANECGILINGNNFINLIELIRVYGQLKTAIETLKVSTRKEIDAANLAAKVQEETLRREQEELISRQKAEELAEQNRLKILAEKKAALEKEINEAAALKEQLAKTKADLAGELEILQAQKDTAKPEEIAVIENKQNDILDSINKVSQVQLDKSNALDTAIVASKNLNNEIQTVSKELQEKGITPKKDIKITPILLTLATGYFLL